MGTTIQLECLGRFWKTKPICTRIGKSSLTRTGLMGGKQLGLRDYEQSTAK
ncbi:MAG: hypothetical protein RLZZ117_1190 [Cyanobacteriota bacterium]